MKEKLKKIKEFYVNHGIPKIILEISKSKSRKKYKKLCGDPEITILSPNCIAGEIYNLLGLKFNSPLINASMKRLDFIEFCLNLDEYLKINPKITGKKNGHPILTLEGNNLKRIDINFVHDNDDNIVLKNWEKRKKRIIKDKIYLIMDNKNEIGQKIDDKIIEKINKFKTVNKIIFVSSESKIDNTFLISNKQIKKYNYKKLSGLYGFQYFFDYIKFLTEK